MHILNLMRWIPILPLSLLERLHLLLLLLLCSCFSFTECLIKELVKCVTAENTMVMDDEDFLLDQTGVKFLWVLFLSSLDLRLRPLSPVLARNLLSQFFSNLLSYSWYLIKFLISHPWYLTILFFFLRFIYFDRERAWAGGIAEGEREPDSPLSSKPNARLDPGIRSWTKPKPEI